MNGDSYRRRPAADRTAKAGVSGTTTADSLADNNEGRDDDNLADNTKEETTA